MRKLILLFTLFAGIFTLGDIYEEVCHVNYRYPKAITLSDGSVLVLSTSTGTSTKASIMSIYDRDGTPISTNNPLSTSFSGNAELVEAPKDQYLLVSHDSKDVNGKLDKELIYGFDEKPVEKVDFVFANSVLQKTSVINVQSGIIAVGAIEKADNSGRSTASLSLVNPAKQKIFPGETFTGYSKFISCTEAKKNNIYCAYVGYEDPFISKLKVRHYSYNCNGTNSTGGNSDDPKPIPKNNYDILFIIDSTSSMLGTINAVKKYTTTIAAKLNAELTDFDIKFGAIYYQDPLTQKAEKTVSFDFTSDINALTTFINQQKATGGGDIPEDWVSAYEAAKKLKWRDGIKLIIHIADAGAHGPHYSTGDKYNAEETKLDALSVEFCNMPNLYIRGFSITNKATVSFNRFNQKCTEFRKTSAFTGDVNAGFLEVKSFDQSNTDPTYFTNMIISSSKEISDKVEMKCELKFEKEKTIKTFYTQFDYLKAIKTVDDEIAILFQSGRKGKPYGDEGTDLFYYLLQVDSTGDILATRYEYIYNNCKYKEDQESYNADIASFNDNKVYVVCETKEYNLHVMIIERNELIITRFNIRPDSEGIKYYYPRFVKFGQNIGLVYSKNGKETAYQIFNFPNCVNAPSLKVALFRSNKIDFASKVKFTNPYPDIRMNEKVYMYWTDIPNGIEIKTLPNEYKVTAEERIDPVEMEFTSGVASGNYTLKYRAIIKNDEDGEISGKTCSVNIITPVCKISCISCYNEPIDPHDYCFGCKPGYYTEEDSSAVMTPFGIYSNCPPCAKGCLTCKIGPGRESWRKNCDAKQCNNTAGYYYVEDDPTLCLNEKEIREYEQTVDAAYFLNDNKTINEIYWKRCHSHCSRCRILGNDKNNTCDICRKDFYFLYNQTWDNYTIPGSCYQGLEGNGFYLDDKNQSDKRYTPCLNNCKLCHNGKVCENCYPNFYLAWTTHDRCENWCEDYLGYDNNTWKCVNCKDEYLNTQPINAETYNWRQKCYYPMPEGYHIINDTFNLITICDPEKRCFTCYPEGTARCTKCFPPFYKEHKLVDKDIFNCYTYQECADAGVPDFTDNDNKLCRNCRLTGIENNATKPWWRDVVDPNQPVYQCIEADPRPNRAYVCNETYHALCACYKPCETCDTIGNVEEHKCTSCRNPKDYDLWRDKNGDKTTNCLRKVLLPCNGGKYYHDYDAIDEDGNEGADVCVEEKRCPGHHPFFVTNTHECVEKCMFEEFFNGVCSMSNPDAVYEYLKNPFNLLDLDVSIKGTVFYDIATKVFANYGESLIGALGIDLEATATLLGSGKSFSLPNTKIIESGDKDYSIAFTSVGLQKKELDDLIKNGNTTAATSKVELCECETKLKEKYGLPAEEDLMIIKGDILRTDILSNLATQVEYMVFSTSIGKKLDLSYCKNSKLLINILQNLNTGTLVKAVPSLRSLEEADAYRAKVDHAIKEGQDPFKTDGPFYNDVCHPFTSEDGTDVLIEDRKSDYFGQVALCEEGCKYQGYNPESRMYTCQCEPKTNIDEFNGEKVKFVPAEMTEDFKKPVRRSNIAVFKCSKQLFSSNGVKNNYGFIVSLLLLVGFIATSVLYIIKGKQWLIDLFKVYIKKVEKVEAKPEIKLDEEKKKYDDSKEESGDGKKKETEIKTGELTEEELNAVDYNTAKNKQRTFIKSYWSFVKQKQLIIYTFFSTTKYNLRIVRIALFLLFLGFFFTFNALFYTDDVIRAVYTYKGNMTAAIHVPNLILSSLCCLITNYLIRFLLLSEKDIIALSLEKNKEVVSNKAIKILKTLKIKLYVLFGVSAVLMGIFWYYVSVFCSVFKNSQGYYFLNVLLTFIVCNVYPFVFSLIVTFLRKRSFSKEKGETLYKASQILALI